MRRSLGLKLDRDAKLLDEFITYPEQRGTDTVTVADALAWATLPAGGSPGWLRMRQGSSKTTLREQGTQPKTPGAGTGPGPPRSAIWPAPAARPQPEDFQVEVATLAADRQ